MRRIPESELIINSDGSVFHLHLRPEQLADTVILVGDQGRVDIVASFFDEGSIEVDLQSREFHTITGKYNGKRISAISTGIGPDNIDIVMTELDALVNVDFETRMEKAEKRSLTILRIGTCGAVQPEIPLGGFIFSQMSLGFDGLLNWYKDRDKVACKEIEEAFVKHMDWPLRIGRPYFVESAPELIERFKDSTIKGLTMSAPGFYGPQGRCVRLTPAIDDLIMKLEQFRFEDWKVTNIEMESSALVSLATLMGHKAATVCCAIANRYAKESQPDYKPFIHRLVKLSLDNLTK